MSDLTLTFHGGLCCGMKTIYGFGYGKDALAKQEPALTKINPDNRDQSARPSDQNVRFFTDEAPKESTEDRLRRYIDFMKRKRPCNILEVTLAEYPKPYGGGIYPFCQSVLFPLMAELGFKEVNKHQNSNSGNIVHVFHLNIDEDYPGKESNEPDGDDEDEPEYDEDCDDDADYCSCGCGMRLS